MSRRDITITVTCAHCGASFHPWTGEAETAARCCSRACHTDAQKAQRAASLAEGWSSRRRNQAMTKTCEHCGQPYHPYVHHEERQRFCSGICQRGYALARVDRAVVYGPEVAAKRRTNLERHATEGRPLVYRSPRQRQADAQALADAPGQANPPLAPSPAAVSLRRPRQRPESLPMTTTTEPIADSAVHPPSLVTPDRPPLADALEPLPPDVAEEPSRAAFTPDDRPGHPLTWPIEGEADRREWADAGERRMAQADRLLRREAASRGKPGRTIILAGQGSFMGVELGDLIVHSGRTHGAPAPEREVLHPALHGVRRILWVGANDRMGGSLTLAGLAWCRREGIHLVVLDGSGEPLMSTWPDELHDAPLRQRQWAVHDTPHLAGALAREIVRMKIEAQAATLEAHRDQLPGAERALEQFKVWKGWLSLPKPPPWQYDLDRLRLIEGRLARHYFGAWEGMPLPWSKTDIPRLPSHWLVARERRSPLSPSGNARHSVDCLNSVLNYACSVTVSQCRQALVAAGLDVCCGYLHADLKGRASLVWDMVELERAAVDHLVLGLLSKTTLHRADFIKDKGGLVTLHPQTVRLVLAACRVPQAQVDGHVKWLADWIRNAEQIAAITPPATETQE